MSRLDQLQTLLQKTPNDPFLLYGIALEHKKAGASELAIEFLDKTIAADRMYCYAYYQKGQVLESLGKAELARAAYASGVAAAQECGDGKALGELQGALGML